MEVRAKENGSEERSTVKKKKRKKGRRGSKEGKA